MSGSRSPGLGFDRIASRYDATRGLPPEVGERLAETIARLTAATAATRFFEPGIGTGRIALPLLRRGHSYTGVDLAPRMLAELRDRARGVPGSLHVVVADASDLPFPDDAFDVAICSHVLHLVPEWPRALDELRRVLQPRGVLLEVSETARPLNPRRELMLEWARICAQLGHPGEPPGARRADVLARLRRQGARLLEFDAASWEQAATPAALCAEFAQRVWSPTWALPDDVLAVASADLLRWAQQRFGDIDAPLRWSRTVTVTVARSWAAGAPPSPTPRGAAP